MQANTDEIQINTSGKELTIDEAVIFVSLNRDSIRKHSTNGLVYREKKVKFCSVQKNIRNRYLYKRTDLVKLKS